MLNFYLNFGNNTIKKKKKYVKIFLILFAPNEKQRKWVWFLCKYGYFAL